MLMDEKAQQFIAGRRLGFFLIDGKARSLTELAELLEVSKASVSTNARLLEKERQQYGRSSARPRT